MGNFAVQRLTVISSVKVSHSPLTEVESIAGRRSDNDYKGDNPDSDECTSRCAEWPSVYPELRVRKHTLTEES